MKKERKASSEILWRIATNLTRLREARGYSQLELARRCGLTNSQISRIERGLHNASVATLEALATGLNCSEADFLMPIGITSREQP